MLEKIKNYLPLIILVLSALAMATAVQIRQVPDLANNTMGFFLCLLAMLKLFDLSGFADGFQMYDLIGKRSRIYALAYPILELTLGLLYISNLFQIFTNITTLIIMLIGLAGVIISLQRGLNIRCACLGTSLNVPLSTVTIVENSTMALMALMNLI